MNKNQKKVELPDSLIDAAVLFDMTEAELQFYVWKIKANKEV